MAIPQSIRNKSPYKESRKGGFALIMSIVLVAFLFLLLVSLSTIVHVESQVQTLQEKENEARMNALVGLRVAIGELQRHSGPDQRVTMAATSLFPHKDFNELYDADKDISTSSIYGDTVPASEQMFEIFKDEARASTLRSYLDSVGTYLVPNERKSFDQRIRDWWNEGKSANTLNDERNPYWTAVLDTSLRVNRASNPRATPSSLPALSYDRQEQVEFGEYKRDQVPIWLVSGNERHTIDQGAAANYPAAYYYRPDVPLEDLIRSDPDLNLTNNSVDDYIVELVGDSAPTAAESADGMHGRVSVAKMPLKNASSAGGGTTVGHYAYWVGDESVKANFAVQDPFSSANEGTPEYRNRLQVPQRVGWERIGGFSDLYDAGLTTIDPNSEDFLKLINHHQLGLIEPLFSDAQGNAGLNASPLKSNFHHITSYSNSLLTSTALGGLRKDLTQYLEDGDGLSDSRPIANPERYAANDPRSDAWSSIFPTIPSQGFPIDNPLALDGVPTWGQVREWYQNEASGAGAGAIEVNGDTFPVLARMMMWWGLSYENGTVFQHWLPQFVLWNPYDVGLQEATYRISPGFSPEFMDLMIAKEVIGNQINADSSPVNPATFNLSSLQDEEEADWQIYTITQDDIDRDGDSIGWHGLDDGIEITKTVGEITTTEVYPLYTIRDTSDSENQEIVAYSEIHSVGLNDQIVIFKGYIDADGDSPYTSLSGQDVADNDDGAYFAAVTKSNEETFDFTYGPWPFPDANMENGTSDAFGNFYYWLKPSIANNINLASTRFGTAGRNGTTNGYLHGDIAGWRSTQGRFSLRVLPFESAVSDTSEERDIDNPLWFEITDSFEAGEAKIFTIAKDFLWNRQAVVPLENVLDEARPSSMRFPLFDVAFGPADAETQDLKIAVDMRSQDSLVNFFPQMTLAGTAGDTTLVESAYYYDESHGLGLVSEGHGGIHGNFIGGEFSEASGNPYNQDDDGDEIRDGEEPHPYLTSTWRYLYNTSNFSDRIASTETSDYESSAMPFLNIAIQPLTGEGSNDAERQFSRDRPVFSRMSIAAESFDFHPFIDGQRTTGFTNNRRPDGTSDGLGGRSSFFLTMDKTPWDDGHSDGNGRGFVVIRNNQDSSDNLYRPLSQLAVRSARRANSEILSLGQLQQVNLAKHYYQPFSVIGSSHASLYTDRSSFAGINSREIGAQLAINAKRHGNNAADASSLPGNQMLDLSYISNENIWDGYFLSSITSSSLLTAALDGDKNLGNSRLRFTDAARAASDGEVRNFNGAAAYLTSIGSLNVNSTSVEAWKALLTAFRDVSVSSQSGSRNPSNTLPIVRSLFPIGDDIPFTETIDDPLALGAVSTDKDYSALLSGFRYLTDSMVQTLAERIVDEVRMRAPFFSLADFVNRRLIPPEGAGDSDSAWYSARTEPVVFSRNRADYMAASYDPLPGLHGISGTIQRALDVSGINGGVNYPTLSPDGIGGSLIREDRVFRPRIKVGPAIDSSDLDNNFDFAATYIPQNNREAHVMGTTYRHYLDTEHLAGMAAGESGALFDGTPAFVTQADILSMIGPALTARGDTFVIRSYGDSVEQETGVIQSQAYLEAVVQRVIEPVEAIAGDAFQTNSDMGRKYRVVSIRWLSEDEV